MQGNQKNLQSREPQAHVKNGQCPISQPDYNTEIRVGEKIVGNVIGDEFIKKVHSTKHFLQKPRGIAFDEDSLEQAQKHGATRVKVIDLDTGIVYQVTIELIYKKGFHFNRGWGNQIGLTLDLWSSHPKSQPGLFDSSIPLKNDTGLQSVYLRGKNDNN